MMALAGRCRIPGDWRPATVLRDLRRDLDWAGDQRDREDMREARERQARWV
jgi:hypothetical protein